MLAKRAFYKKYEARVNMKKQKFISRVSVFKPVFVSPWLISHHKMWSTHRKLIWRSILSLGKKTCDCITLDGCEVKTARVCVRLTHKTHTDSSLSFTKLGLGVGSRQTCHVTLWRTAYILCRFRLATSAEQTHFYWDTLNRGHPHHIKVKTKNKWNRKMAGNWDTRGLQGASVSAFRLQFTSFGVI